MNPNNPQVFWICLFCGFGGETTGIHNAGVNARVIACVNHDANAIKSHAANHPDCLHLTEDIRDLAVIDKLGKLVEKYRKEYPGCIINLWASIECTNYSKAKGGLPRDADSRTLADHLLSYVFRLSVDYLYVENVREYLSWGDLNSEGKPISKNKGKSYLRWKENICSLGYRYDHRILDAADFGAYTSRIRYFGQFAKIDLPISWPEATHCRTGGKKGENQRDLFGKKFLPWKPVREVLDLDDEGESIFERKKPLAEKTLNRIYAGLVKFVPENEYETVDFLSSYYGNGSCHSLEAPSPTLTTKDRLAKLCVKRTTVSFLDQQYGNSKPVSMEQPAGTITANPKLNLVHVRFDGCKAPGYALSDAVAVDQEVDFTPVPYSSKKQHKEAAFVAVMVKIRLFMLEHGISDIRMRMLNIKELLRIQGFNADYKMIGTKTEWKKFIGNSVHPEVAEDLCLANYSAVAEYMQDKVKKTFEAI